jgi:hypothetical protein
MTFKCTWQEFKVRAKEFHIAAPTLDIEELDNAWKCLGLSYLGMQEQMWVSSAAILLEIEAKIYSKREIELTLKDRH